MQLIENQEEKIRERLVKARKLLKKNQKDFGSKVGYSQSMVSEIEKGIKNITENYLKLISLEYKIAVDWLKTGEGDIYLPVIEAKPVYNDIVEVPIVQTKARAGYARAYNNPEFVNNLPKIFIPKQYEKGNYMVFEIEGDSMDDGTKRSILEGDCYLCKELEFDFWKERLYYKKYLFLIVYDESVICKQIKKHDVENGILTCHSFNPIYEDFTVNLKDVHQIFYLVKLVERKINF